MTREEINHVGRLLKKLLILAVLLFLFDRGIGSLVEYEYKKNPPPDAKAFGHVIKNPSEDVFIFGSSKAAHGYVSTIFAGTLGLSCFNAGREQTNILYADVVMNAMLRQHAPKIIILDINAKETVSHGIQNSKNVLASMLMPYVKNDTALQSVANELFEKEYIIAKLSLLQEYNSQLLPLLMSMKKKETTRFSEDGYVAVHGSKVTGELPAFEDRGEQYDSTAKNYFEDFITTVQSKNIKLYVIQSPYYVQKFTTSPSLKELKAIIQKHNVKYLDYSFDTAFYKKEYFYDNLHLNDKGAHLFSEKIAVDIKEDLKKNDPSFFDNNKQTVER